MASFRDASDADVVSDAAGAWADLSADHDTVRKLAEALDDDLPILRAARAEVRAGAQGLPEDAGVALRELDDLLAAGELLAHRGKIKELTKTVGDARRDAAAEVADALSGKLEEVRASIRAQFAEMDANKLDEALRPIEELSPPSDPTAVPLGDLLGRAELIESRAATAVRLLEELQAAGNLARLSVAELVTDPITTEEELDVALDRIRQAAVAELADGKQVRLQ